MRVLQCYFTQANCRTCWSGHFLHCLASFIGTFIAALVCCWTDFPVLHLDVDKLGPVYMGKSCPCKKSHPFSRVNFSERLYDKNADPFARASSVHTCSDSFALTESIQLSEPKCLHWEMLPGYVEPLWLYDYFQINDLEQSKFQFVLFTN